MRGKWAAAMAWWCLTGGLAAAHAQVRCTMPNGRVIEQQLSSVCPRGAVRAETLAGQPAQIREQSAPVKDKAGHMTQLVTSREMGGDWPLAVSSGLLRCVRPVRERPDLHALLVEADGRQYALNGGARDHAARHGWLPIAAVWRDNPAIPGSKVPLSALLARASALCGAAQVVAPAQQDPEVEFIQARALCEVARSNGASLCQVSAGFVGINEMRVAALQTVGQARALCDKLKLAARQKYPAVAHSARGWKVLVMHPAGTQPMLSCEL